MLFSVFGEVLFQLFFEVLIELGWRSGTEGFRAKQRAHPLIAAIGLVILGALSGLLISLVLPNRVFAPRGIPGASLVLSPLITGFLMHSYGDWCRSRGREASYFSTFWGGALFALSMAAVRFGLVG